MFYISVLNLEILLQQNKTLILQITYIKWKYLTAAELREVLGHSSFKILSGTKN
jgi:hypothetical protein